ncbi:MAG: SDR family NAD(P)-dependent oxidoreductase [Nocardioides sp.]
MPDLQGQHAVVVGGGGQGIGRSVSLALATAGARVTVVDLDPEQSSGVVDEIVGLGGRADSQAANACSSDEVNAAIDAAAEGSDGIDVLVTVVGGVRGLAPWQPVHQHTDAQWAAILDLNLTSAFLSVRAALTHMVPRGRGSIVAVGSLSGMRGAPNHAAYGAAKAGVIHLARSVAIEYGRHGIRMNAVSPGRVDTPATSDTLDDAAYRVMAERVPLGRMASPDDIAAAVAFLASPESAYISGQVLTVDGGASARFPLPIAGTDPSEAF